MMLSEGLAMSIDFYVNHHKAGGGFRMNVFISNYHIPFLKKAAEELQLEILKLVWICGVDVDLDNKEEVIKALNLFKDWIPKSQIKESDKEYITDNIKKICNLIDEYVDEEMENAFLG